MIKKKGCASIYTSIGRRSISSGKNSGKTTTIKTSDHGTKVKVPVIPKHILKSITEVAIEAQRLATKKYELLKQTQAKKIETVRSLRQVLVNPRKVISTIER